MNVRFPSLTAEAVQPLTARFGRKNFSARKSAVGTKSKRHVRCAAAFGASSDEEAGYGIKIKVRDRDEYLRREWKTFQLIIPGIKRPVSANIDKDSFWCVRH